MNPPFRPLFPTSISDPYCDPLGIPSLSQACLLKAPSENHENLLHVAVDICALTTGDEYATEEEYRACVAKKVRPLSLRSLSLVARRHNAGARDCPRRHASL